MIMEKKMEIGVIYIYIYSGNIGIGEKKMEYLGFRVYWVAVKGLNLSYYVGETILITIYIYTQDGSFA